MKLLTKAIEKTLPKLYTQENEKDPVVYVKFFLGAFTWYALEGEKQSDGDWLFFAWCHTHSSDDELSYVTLSQLRGVHDRFGLGVERDMYFEPKPLSEIKTHLQIRSLA